MNTNDKAVQGTNVEVWMSQVNETNTGMAKALEKQTGVSFAADDGAAADKVISIDETNTYQEMEGFGASITEASAFLYQEYLSADDKASLFKALFDRDEGIAVNMIRQTIGASDHCVAPYTFAPEPQSEDIPDFDFSHELETIFPTVQDAIAASPESIKFVASCWSPPGWMKENNSELGMFNDIRGSLKTDMYQAYSNYLLKFVEEYDRRGVHIDWITVCNEPDHASYDWPALPMYVEEQINLVTENLHQTFADSPMDTEIVGWDHSYTTTHYPDGAFAFDLLENEDAREKVKGTAWHWYEGKEETMLLVHKKYPEKGIWFTEGSGGEWEFPKWQTAFFNQTKCVVNIARNWSQNIIFWNLALDENGSPGYYYVENQGANSTNRGLVTINREERKWEYNVDYYTLGHISKFVLPGAVRIDTNTLRKDVETVAFRNPDGSKIMLVSNQTLDEKDVKFVWGDQSFSYHIPSGAMLTLKWEGEQNGRTVIPTWYNNFETTDGFSAGEYAEVEKTEGTANIGSNNCIRMTTTNNGDPAYRTQCAIVEPGAGSTVDTRGYEYMVFSIKDDVNPAGSTVRITFVDEDGNYDMVWSDEKTQYENWTRIWFAMGQVQNVDRSRIKEIHFAEYWQGDYYIDDISFALGYKDDIPQVGETMNLVLNPSFENDGSPDPHPVHWNYTGTTPEAAYLEENDQSQTGRFHYVHSSQQKFDAFTWQEVTGLESGSYTLRAWVQSGGGQNECVMSVSGHGGKRMFVDFPESTPWVQIEINNIPVTTGICEIGFRTDGNPGDWSCFDSVEFYKQS